MPFPAQAAPEARLWQFHPTQTVTDEPDGSLTVRFTAGGIEEMCDDRSDGAIGGGSSHPIACGSPGAAGSTPPARPCAIRTPRPTVPDAGATAQSSS
ncbi:WYL domain-containing protein [Paracoccus mutanolyticus]|uniref:WYL domain-containing protein n=1 Tax=Paracoccus mutanolyticus TaxID=1499308 RepID=UPI0011AE5FA9|nr:WYL domain-containing protein [Paracoccus mutanolyticus]